MRGFTVLLIVFGVVVGLAVAVFNVRYEAPGGTGDLDIFESVYAVFTLLLFGSAYEWPQDTLTRLLFFLVPLMGMAVVGQTALGISSAVVNRERWEVAVASTFENHVIVCGLGKVGIRVVRWLRHLGRDVVVVESNENEPRLKKISSWKIPVIFGDATDAAILKEANIDTAASIVPITNDDLANLMIATAARALRPELHVVLRTFDENLAANLKTGFDIHTAFSTSALAAPAFAAASLDVPVDYAFAFGEDRMLLTVTEFVVVTGSMIVGYTVERLERDFDLEVLAVRDPEAELNPPLDRTLNEGARFVVSGKLDSIAKLAQHTPAARELERYERTGRLRTIDPTR